MAFGLLRRNIWLLGLLLCPPAWADEAYESEPALTGKPAQCLAHYHSRHQGRDEAAHSALRQEIEAFQALAEEALFERERAIRAATLLRDKRANGEPLSGGNLENLRLGILGHLALRGRLMEMAELHECWLDEPAPWADGHPAGQADRDQAVLLSLASALLLYDNYLLAISVFEQDTHLRRIFDQADSGWALDSRQLTEAKKLFLSGYNRQRVKRAIRYYQEQILPRKETLAAKEAQYLLQLVEQSPAYAMIQKQGLPGKLLADVGLFNRFTVDMLNHLRKEGVNLFSMLFGNAIGVIETRRGYLYQNQEARRELLASLEPGDILLEKTPFRLTDMLIPGYWGHVAIWVGDEPSLRRLGVWDHPAVSSHQQDIRAGKGVVEALRAGVTTNTLAHFMNVDDLLVIRDRSAAPEIRAARVLRAFRQVGKPYDFNFDVETTDRIVCSELVYQVFTEMPWPTSRTLGRATISPDQVAVRALEGGSWQIVSLYQSGERIEGNMSERLRVLLAGKKAERLASLNQQPAGEEFTASSAGRSAR